MTRPDCFGHIALGHRSPCHGCTINALCAAKRTMTQSFGVMLYPRKDPIAHESVPIDLPSMAPIDADIAKQITTPLSLAGLHQSRGRVWQWKTKRFVRIQQANRTRVTLEFFVSPSIVELADGYEKVTKLVPVLKNAKSIKVLTPAQITKRRGMATGSIAYFSNASDAVTLAIQVLKIMYSEGENHGCG